jgi:hypothetical protein
VAWTFAVAGRSASGSTGSADPSQLISSPVVSGGVLRAARRVVGLEVGGGLDGELFGLPFAEADRPGPADGVRDLLEGHDRRGLGHALLDPRRVAARAPGQVGVLRVQVVLPLGAVREPGRLHLPEDHGAASSVSCLEGGPVLTVGVADVVAASLTAGPLVEMGLSEQPRALERVGPGAFLERGVLKPVRLPRSRPGNHLLHVRAQRSEHVLEVGVRGVRAALGVAGGVWDAGVPSRHKDWRRWLFHARTRSMTGCPARDHASGPRTGYLRFLI